MANYFRSTSHLFESGPDTFKRLDYIIKRHFGDISYKYFDEWRDAFLLGLKTVSEKGNLYIASVFHNVLATYYLNRASQASAYQVDRLKKREIYIDTNVLYSLLVPASNYHETTSYFVSRLKKLGINLRVFPFTLEEYEHSLQIVERNVGPQGPSEFVVRWNPWLYQEYKLNSSRYLGRISVCRMSFSILQDMPLTDENRNVINKRLAEQGLVLEDRYEMYSQDQVNELWLDMRNMMASSKWELHQYWEFIYEQANKSDTVIRHDVSCVENVRQRAASQPGDDLGPIVMFMTLDSKLLRLRRRYPFIVSAEQFLEFMLPYLFITDIPVKEPERFPNQLLSAQLGTLLVRKPPELAEEVGAFLNDPSLLSLDRDQLRLKGSTIGIALSSDRFKAIVESAQACSASEKAIVATEASRLLEEMASEERDSYFKSRNLEAELDELKDEVKNKDQKIDKLQRTLKY